MCRINNYKDIPTPNNIKKIKKIIKYNLLNGYLPINYHKTNHIDYSIDFCTENHIDQYPFHYIHQNLFI